MLMAHQDPEVSKFAQYFILISVPRFMMFGLFDCMRKWLNNQGYNIIPMQCQALTIPLHALNLYVFVVKMGMELNGVALSGVITLTSANILASLTLRRHEKFKNMVLAIWK